MAEHCKLRNLRWEIHEQNGHSLRQGIARWMPETGALKLKRPVSISWVYHALIVPSQFYFQMLPLFFFLWKFLVIWGDLWSFKKEASAQVVRLSWACGDGHFSMGVYSDWMRWSCILYILQPAENVHHCHVCRVPKVLVWEHDFQ